MNKTLESITCHSCGVVELKESAFCSDATLEQYVCSNCHDEHYSVTPYQSGDWLYVLVNQGKRDALVLGTLGEQIIVEYTMPSGTTALLIVEQGDRADRFGKRIKGISYKSCPKKWIQAIRDGVGSWEGICQRNGQIDFPEESVETLSDREELEEQHGQVWNTKELQQDFTVQGFASPCVLVIRKSDGVKGTLEFIHQPRFYFDFVEAG